jgi:hypothetical protein
MFMQYGQRIDCRLREHVHQHSSLKDVVQRTGCNAVTRRAPRAHGQCPPSAIDCSLPSPEEVQPSCRVRAMLDHGQRLPVSDCVC